MAEESELCASHEASRGMFPATKQKDDDGGGAPFVYSIHYSLLTHKLSVVKSPMITYVENGEAGEAAKPSHAMCACSSLHCDLWIVSRSSGVNGDLILTCEGPVNRLALYCNVYEQKMRAVYDTFLAHSRCHHRCMEGCPDVLACLLSAGDG